MAKILEWFGFGADDIQTGHSDHGKDGTGGHGHTHGVIDASLTTTDRGVWAIKWSFIILAITAALQLSVVFISGSVALLADTIHNIGDAVTAIPLWVAFVLVRRKPSATFTYGLGRVEDLAGILIVLIILFSAVVAGYEAISRLIHPQPVTQLGWLAAAGVVGFIGNEAVAVFRIRVGRQMNSAALIADGYHARTDGLTSLAVVLGAVGVYFGYSLADPIIGLLITLTIFGIVWQSAKAVLTRALDGVEPGITAEIRHAAEHVPGVAGVTSARARWIGHRLHADVEVAVAATASVGNAAAIAVALKAELFEHLPALRTVNVMLAEGNTADVQPVHTGHHVPEPFRFDRELATGELAIVDTTEGERMQLKFGKRPDGVTAKVVIKRAGLHDEILSLEPVSGNAWLFLSQVAPAEPHEFDATLHLAADTRHEALDFRITEPVGHTH